MMKMQQGEAASGNRNIRTVLMPCVRVNGVLQLESHCPSGLPACRTGSAPGRRRLTF